MALVIAALGQDLGPVTMEVARGSPDWLVTDLAPEARSLTILFYIRACFHYLAAFL